jgi:hypothetical protein
MTGWDIWDIPVPTGLQFGLEEGIAARPSAPLTPPPEDISKAETKGDRYAEPRHPSSRASDRTAWLICFVDAGMSAVALDHAVRSLSP